MWLPLLSGANNSAKSYPYLRQKLASAGQTAALTLHYAGAAKSSASVAKSTPSIEQGDLDAVWIIFNKLGPC